MSLCRRLLFQVRTPKIVSRFVSGQRYLSDATRSSSPPNYQLHNIYNVQPNNGTHPSLAPAASRSASVSDQDLLRSLSDIPSKFAEAEKGQMETTPTPSKLSAYGILRSRDRASLAALPADVYHVIAAQAFDHKSPEFISYIVTDILEIYRGTESERNDLTQSLLSMADWSLLRPDQVLSMLSSLSKTPSALSSLPRKVVEHLVRWFIDATSSSSTDAHLLEIICSIIINHLKNSRVPSGALVISYFPPAIVHVSYAFVQKLLRIGQDSLALSVFQVLVDTRHIPPEAVQAVNSQSRDFPFIICSTLVRACLHWGWRTLAGKFLMDMFRTGGIVDESIVDLTVDTSYELLETPSSKDVSTCGLLLREVHVRIPDAIIPHGLFRKFYSSAHQRSLGAEAERIYSFTRSSAVLQIHQYPPPQGQALTWLMHHLTVKSRNQHLGRELATQVVEGDEPISLQDRARFIALAAINGYARLARTLWERYSVGKDRNAVVGHSALMIRMISLFTHLINRTDAVLRKRGIDSDLITSSSSDERLIEELDTNHHQQQLKDLSTFTELVFSEYRKLHEPLADAHHHALTTLARAYFILGRFAEGFEIFKYILDRKEIPDLYDINVALTALAEHQPRGAARMIERMIEKGLQPDAITFGTVMYHGLAHQDTSLVNDMIGRARGLNGGQVTLKSVAALIRASLASDDESLPVQRSNLIRALDVVTTLKGSNFVCSPNIGKYCIFASLRADDPVMAYKFWALLIKDRTEWDDREQRFQRRLIGKMIRSHHIRGWLDDDRCLIMLSQLREKKENVRGLR